jgi:hypothetical protein
MGLPIIGDIIDAVKDLAGEVIVDKDKRNEINLKLKEIEDRTNERLHEELIGQIEINKIEAAHNSIFVAGWRPFIGWTGGVGLGWTFVASPIVEFVANVFGYAGKMPEVDTTQLLTLILAMLGVGAMRTYEKTNKVKDATQIND